jgi:alanine dehydrogenase
MGTNRVLNFLYENHRVKIDHTAGKRIGYQNQEFVKSD